MAYERWPGAGEGILWTDLQLQAEPITEAPSWFFLHIKKKKIQKNN